MTYMTMLWVGIGGVVGALLRYQVSRAINARTSSPFPWATLAINLSGSWLLGWLTSHLHKLVPTLHNVPMLVLGVGLCGAYTTFSTFSYEAVSLFRARQEILSLTYVALSCLGGLALSAMGLYGLPHSHP
ncbi:chromosome condensation protein CcrB [Alicyclobacillus hesperidum]|uniref:Fluoride-specific ion channel FluC n=2 Tax=Alicyclobacillus hesperidum TaxID=89784 RepID=A0A1H2UED0_9BACL|nr:chromosome condensation protein CcrB [Alicyclobacillus hesperidum]SDW53844.1 CrcB protein [Alicyclobacillus hesperidum]